MADNQVLDLTNPGKVWAAIVHHETSTFHLVVPNAANTKGALAKNPQINPKDQLMSPLAISHKEVGKDGTVALDFITTGRAKEIIGRLDRQFDAGIPAPKVVRAVILATAREGNRIPEKYAAETIDFDLAPTPKLKLTEKVVRVPVQDFKNGKKDFIVELQTDAIPEIEISTTPGAQVRVDGGPSGTSFKMKAEAAKKYTLRIAVNFKSRKESQSTNVPKVIHSHHGSLRNGQPWAWIWYTPAHTRVDTREVWEGGDVTLRVTGTGMFSGIVKTAKLRAESWASAWLIGPSVPKCYIHGSC